MLGRLVCRRGLSSLVTQQQARGVLSLQLSSKPVNAISLDLCRQLTSTLRQLEDDKAVRGVLIGSAVSGVFSGGLDLKALILTSENTEDAVAEFWTAVQEMWLTLYMTPLATVASISGHCPAGGCLLALSCDARVMAEGKYTIGLNEAKLGLVPPAWLSAMLKDTVGQRKADWMLQLAQMLKPADAAAAGVVDEIVPLSHLHDASMAKMSELLQVPDGARAMIKQQLRRNAANSLRDFQSEDLDEFLGVVLQPSVQAGLIQYAAALKTKESD